jgi:hypothetical protein
LSRSLSGIGEAGSAAANSVAAHPIPAMMIGAGLAWLFLESRTLRPYEKRLIGGGRRAIGALSETTGSLREGLSEGLHTAGDYARGGAAAVRDAFYEGAGLVSRKAQKGLQSTRQTFGQTWESHPLLVCAGLLAAGVAAAILLPETAREQRWMGDASDAVTRTVRNKGRQLVRKGKQLARETVGTVQREARRQGLTTSDLTRKVKRVAEKARDVVVGQ